MTPIVGVHGIGNYRTGETADQTAARLSTVWGKALRRGDVTVAFYGDLLRRPGAHGDDDEPDAEFVEFADAWFRAIPDMPTGVAAGRSMIQVRQAAETLAKVRGLGSSATRLLVSSFCREVPRYLGGFGDDIRRAVRARVVAAITATGARVVVAHSLGSVVAYEALWESGQELDLLLTLGSPLALPGAVFPRLDPAPVHDRGARPPGVRRWVNIADVGDVVAIPKGGVAARFDGVDHDDHTVVGAFDFHTVSGYLRTPEVRTALGSCP